MFFKVPSGVFGSQILSNEKVDEKAVTPGIFYGGRFGVCSAIKYPINIGL